MPINTNGLQELLSVIAQQKAMQMRNAEREQEQKNFNAKFEEDKKRYQDALKMDEAKFKAERADRKAIEDRMAAQFQLMKQQRLDEIQQRASETGQLPAGSLDARQGIPGMVLPPGVYLPNELGVINPQDPKAYAKLQGEIKFEKDKPELDFVQKFKLAQDAARDAADIKQAEIRAAEQARATTENNETRRQYNEGVLALRSQIAANQAATAAEKAAEKAEKEAALAAAKEERDSKLSEPVRKSVVELKAMEEDIDTVADLFHATVEKGSFKGQKVGDAQFVEGFKDRFTTAAKKWWDAQQKVDDSKIVSFNSKLASIQNPIRRENFGVAFTQPEEKRAFFDMLDQLDKATSKEKAAGIIANLQEMIHRKRTDTVSTLTPTQLKYLDENLKPTKKFRTDARTGKRVVR